MFKFFVFLTFCACAALAQTTAGNQTSSAPVTRPPTVPPEVEHAVYYVSAEFEETSNISRGLRALKEEYLGGRLGATRYIYYINELMDDFLHLISNITGLEHGHLQKRVFLETFNYEDDNNPAFVYGDTEYFFLVSIYPSPFPRDRPSKELASQIFEAMAPGEHLDDTLDLVDGSAEIDLAPELMVGRNAHSIYVNVTYAEARNGTQELEFLADLWQVEKDRVILIEPDETLSMHTYHYYLAPPNDIADDHVDEFAFYFSLRSDDIAEKLNATHFQMQEINGILVSPDTIGAHIGIYMEDVFDPAFEALWKVEVLEEFARIQQERELPELNIEELEEKANRIHGVTIKDVLFDGHYVQFGQFAVRPPIYSNPASYLNDNTDLYLNYLLADLWSGRSQIDLGRNNSIKVLFASSSTTAEVPANLEDRCTVICPIEHSVCHDDGTNTGTRRCYCQRGYVAKDEDECEPLLSSYDDSECRQCEKNGGLCYGDDETKEGCKCPVDRGNEFFGPAGNCSRDYVDVHCMNHFMDICVTPFDIAYSPHFTNYRQELLAGSRYHEAAASLHLYGHEGTDPCGFVLVDIDMTELTGCNHGDYYLRLDLRKGERRYCGTEKIQTSGAITRYENTIEARPAWGPGVQFDVFCDFEKRGAVSSGVVDVPKKPDGNTGTVERAKLEFNVFDQNGFELKPGSSVSEHEVLRMQISMDDEHNIFDSIKVEFCTVSDSAELSDANAEEISVIQHGCPAIGQSVFNQLNIFKPKAGNLAVLHTYPFGVEAFRIPQSHKETLFFHCTVKICENQEECKPSECYSIDGKKYGGYGRKKRSAGDRTKTLSYGVRVRRDVDDSDPFVQSPVVAQSSFLQSTAFIVMMATIGVVCTALIITVGALIGMSKKTPTKPMRGRRHRVQADNEAFEADDCDA